MAENTKAKKIDLNINMLKDLKGKYEYNEDINGNYI